MCLLRMTPSEKDLEILFLKQQLLVVRRRQKRCPRLGRWEKFILISLWEQIHSRYQMQKVGLHQISMLFKPDTLLRWHRDLVKKKWTFDTTAKRRGRPSVSPEIEQLVVQLAKENDWGAGKIEGELQKLGYRICKQTVLNILKRHDISPLPQRDRTSNWRSFIKGSVAKNSLGELPDKENSSCGLNLGSESKELCDELGKWRQWNGKYV